MLLWSLTWPVGLLKDSVRRGTCSHSCFYHDCCFQKPTLFLQGAWRILTIDNPGQLSHLCPPTSHVWVTTEVIPGREQDEVQPPCKQTRCVSVVELACPGCLWRVQVSSPFYSCTVSPWGTQRDAVCGIWGKTYRDTHRSHMDLWQSLGDASLGGTVKDPAWPMRESEMSLRFLVLS